MEIGENRILKNGLKSLAGTKEEILETDNQSVCRLCLFIKFIQRK
jgi:hypothetical protein